MTLRATISNPVPDGAVSGTLTTADGVALRFARFPAQAPRLGTVALLGGRSEFIEKYFEVIRELQARGFAVAMFDWRGQGGSQRLLRNPRKGHVRSFRDYQCDLAAFARQVMLPDCPPPYYALGHSMGGTILLQSVLAGHRWFDRMVLSAPMLGLKVVPMEPVARRVVGFLSAVGMARAFIPGGGPGSVSNLPFEGNRVTSDPVRYARTAQVTSEHPDLALGAPTNGWLNAAYDAMDELAEPDVIRRIRQPLLIIAAGADTLVSNAAIEHLSARLIAGAHVVVPASRHEPLMERDIFRAQFWAAFDAFIPGTAPF